MPRTSRFRSSAGRTAHRTDLLTRGRAPLLAAALVALVAGLWGGLARMGLVGPAPGDATVSHGAVLVIGFVGTLVALERAVVTRRWWADAAPVLAVGSALEALAGVPAPLPAATAFGAAVAFAAVALRGAPASPAIVRTVMTVSALAWAGGAVVWWSGLPAFRAVPWWLAFAVLVIAAERMELSRALRPAALTDALPFAAGALALIGGAAASLFDPAAGLRVAGYGALFVALWLTLRDRAALSARSTPGVRFSRLAIGMAYGWLAVGGLFLVVHDGTPAGPWYDATIHALFVGFVVTMIFGHGPMIVPGIVGRALLFRRAAYVPLVLLQVSLLSRIAGDMLGRAHLRDAGVIGIAAAFALYGITIAASLRARRVDSAPVPAAGPR